jgi:hypothetical protein
MLKAAALHVLAGPISCCRADKQFTKDIHSLPGHIPAILLPGAQSRLKANIGHYMYYGGPFYAHAATPWRLGPVQLLLTSVLISINLNMRNYQRRNCASRTEKDFKLI